MNKADLLCACATAAAALPEHTRSKPKCGADYGEVKPVRVKLTYYRPKSRKKGKRK